MSTAFQQELLGTIANPTPKPGPILIPVKKHDITGQRYIPVCEIRAIFPHMIKLEVDGQIIAPIIGFKSLEPAVKDAHKSLDAAASEKANHIDLCVNEEKAPQASDPPSEDNKSGDDRDPGKSESDDKTMNDNESEAVHWIPYYPDKMIHVVHNIPCTSSSTVPVMQQFSVGPLHFALTTPTTSATPESLIATVPASPPTLVPFELPEAYWVRFRKEIQKILHDHYQGALPQGQVSLQQEQVILPQELESQQQELENQKPEQETKKKEQEDQHLEQESQQPEHGSQQQDQENTTISLPPSQDENIVNQPAVLSYLSHATLPKSPLHPASEVDNGLTLSRPTSPKDKPSVLQKPVSPKNKPPSRSRPVSLSSKIRFRTG
ncbi:hypothetical protein BG011_003761 [Mortierella polycephala]|uniref:Uncharacterized protein n=1 Tax=Mortierella polycephala TaxID=41804 RepID=A0A9P6Q1Z7_9FUNG|nr:hypothetical protein BG011_003761 [Mortierella polycephala]